MTRGILWLAPIPILAVALLLPTSATASRTLTVPNCPIDKVTYVFDTAERGDGAGITAGFERQLARTSFASDLLFWIKTPTRTYWFSFSSPNGYGGTYIWPDLSPQDAKAHFDAEEAADDAAIATGLDPPSSAPPPANIDQTYPNGIGFDAFDARLRPYNGPPQANDPPPARLFAHDLGPAFWYDIADISPDAKERESLPIAMLRPDGCHP